MIQDSITNTSKEKLSLAKEKEELLNAVKPENVKEGVTNSVSEVSNYMEKLIAMAIDAIPAIVKAILILVVGLFLID